VLFLSKKSSKYEQYEFAVGFSQVVRKPQDWEFVTRLAIGLGLPIMAGDSALEPVKKMRNRALAHYI
jgi:hypothetical protein